MTADDAFAEYVALRWSVLYRLAVLLVGDDLADEVTREALVRACASWSEIEQSASRDASVTGILVGTAIDVARRAGRPDAAAARERAAVVLRYYEDLSETGIADLLGRAPTMTDAVASPDDLREELRDRAAEVEPGPPPVDEVVRAARRRKARRTRRALGLLAVLVVAAVGIGAAVDHPGTPAAPAATTTKPRLFSDLPTGDPSQVAYLSGTTLHVGDADIALQPRPTRVVQRGDVILVGYDDGRILRYPPNGKPTILADASDGFPVLSEDGLLAAWLKRGKGPAVVVVRSLVSDEVNERSFPARPSCCDNPFTIDGITTTGLLVASLPAAGRSWVWEFARPGAAVEPIRFLDDRLIREVVSDGVAYEDPASSDGSVTLSGLDGATEGNGWGLGPDVADLSVPGRVVHYAPDGLFRVADEVYGTTAAAHMGDLALRLPPHLELLAMHQEDGPRAVMQVQPEGSTGQESYLVRCDTSTGACEYLKRIALTDQLAQ